MNGYPLKLLKWLAASALYFTGYGVVTRLIFDAYSEALTLDFMHFQASGFICLYMALFSHLILKHETRHPRMCVWFTTLVASGVFTWVQSEVGFDFFALLDRPFFVFTIIALPIVFEVVRFLMTLELNKAKSDENL